MTSKTSNFFKLFILFTLSLPLSLIAQEKVAAKFCQKAVVEIEKGNYEKAISLLMSAKAKDSNYVETYIRLGDVYSFMKNPEKAANTYNIAISKLKNPRAVLYLMAAEEELRD